MAIFILQNNVNRWDKLIFHFISLLLLIYSCCLFSKKISIVTDRIDKQMNLMVILTRSQFGEWINKQ